MVDQQDSLITLVTFCKLLILKHTKLSGFKNILNKIDSPDGKLQNFFVIFNCNFEAMHPSGIWRIPLGQKYCTMMHFDKISFWEILKHTGYAVWCMIG